MLVTGTKTVSNIGFRLICAWQRNTSSSQCWISSHLCLSQEHKQCSILDFFSFMLVTGTQAVFNIGFRLIYACHRNTSSFQYWISSYICLSQEHKQFPILDFVSFVLSQEHKQFSMLAFVSFMLVTGTQAVSNIGIRLVFACHRSTSSFQYWKSCHLCFSQEHKQFSRLTNISFMLVIGTQAVFNIGFRLIHACHKNKQFSTLDFVSFMLVTGTQAVFNIGFRLIYACHRSTTSVQCWISSYLCLSHEDNRCSISDFVSFMLSQEQAVFNTEFRVIYAWDRNTSSLLV